MKKNGNKIPNPIFVVTKDLFFSLVFFKYFIHIIIITGGICVCVFVRCLGPINLHKKRKQKYVSIFYFPLSFPLNLNLRAKLSNPFTEYNLLKIHLKLLQQTIGWFIKYYFACCWCPI